MVLRTRFFHFLSLLRMNCSALMLLFISAKVVLIELSWCELSCSWVLRCLHHVTCLLPTTQEKIHCAWYLPLNKKRQVTSYPTFCLDCFPVSSIAITSAPR